jgi:hypothetical protein
MVVAAYAALLCMSHIGVGVQSKFVNAGSVELDALARCCNVIRQRAPEQCAF